jgi:hypothetical protein
VAPGRWVGGPISFEEVIFTLAGFAPAQDVNRCVHMAGRGQPLFARRARQIEPFHHRAICLVTILRKIYLSIHRCVRLPR